MGNQNVFNRFRDLLQCRYDICIYNQSQLHIEDNSLWTIHSKIMELPEKSVQFSALKEVYKRQHLLFIPVIFLRAPKKTYSVSSFHSSVQYILKSFHLNIQGLKLFTYELLAGTKLYYTIPFKSFWRKSMEK